MQRLGVHVHLRTPVDPDVVREARPDEVVVATGSTPRRDGFQLSTPSIPVPGAQLPHVFTSWDVLGFGGRATIGSTAVVYDDTGTFEAISTADVLVAAGAAVTVISRMEQLGANVPYPPATVEASRERLFAARVRFVPAMALREITPTEVVVRGIGNDVVDTYPADTVVIVSYHEPNRELADLLAGEELPRSPRRRRHRHRQHPGRHPRRLGAGPPALGVLARKGLPRPR